MVAQHFPGGRIVLAFLAAGLMAACDDSGGGPRTNNLVSSPTAAMAVRISPLQPQLAPTPLATCPMTQPFATHFDLVVGPANSEFLLDSMTLRFGDGLNLFPLFFTKDDLALRFGTTRIPAGASRVFTMNPEFGCGFSTPPRLLLVDVTLLDGRGGRHEATATATFGS